jgi:hypothetical protein
MTSDQQAASSSVDVERAAIGWRLANTGDEMDIADWASQHVDSLLAALERAQQEVAELRALCLKADSTLSLLRHRDSVRWGNPALPTESEVDQVIGSLRRAYE